MTRTVVVVDDEADIREIVVLSLEAVHGWRVVQVPSGAQAVEVVAAERPDAVLLDVMMPDLDGPTTFAALQREPATAHVPVVFLTAKTQAAERDALVALGAVGVLSKPFDPMTLGGELAALMGWPA